MTEKEIFAILKTPLPGRKEVPPGKEVRCCALCGDEFVCRKESTRQYCSGFCSVTAARLAKQCQKRSEREV